MGRDNYTIDGKEYEECTFCRAACPARDRFKEPDSGLPLRCDMCEDDPPQEKPLCVQWCLSDVLTYEEREEEVEESVEMEKVEAGLTAMINEYGWQKVKDTVARMSIKD
jgi:Fe-S-cluster-containing dehydrogenase component